MPLRTVSEFILIPYDVDENSILHLLMFTTILSIMSFDLGTLSVNIFLSTTVFIGPSLLRTIGKPIVINILEPVNVILAPSRCSTVKKYPKHSHTYYSLEINSFTKFTM